MKNSTETLQSAIADSKSGRWIDSVIRSPVDGAASVRLRQNGSVASGPHPLGEKVGRGWPVSLQAAYELADIVVHATPGTVFRLDWLDGTGGYMTGRQHTVPASSSTEETTGTASRTTTLPAIGPAVLPAQHMSSLPPEAQLALYREQQYLTHDRDRATALVDIVVAAGSAAKRTSEGHAAVMAQMVSTMRAQGEVIVRLSQERGIPGTAFERVMSAVHDAHETKLAAIETVAEAAASDDSAMTELVELLAPQLPALVALLTARHRGAQKRSGAREAATAPKAAQHTDDPPAASETDNTEQYSRDTITELVGSLLLQAAEGDLEAQAMVTDVVRALPKDARTALLPILMGAM